MRDLLDVFFFLFFLFFTRALGWRTSACAGKGYVAVMPAMNYE